MKDLFLKSECDGSIINEEKSTSKRKELDPERVKILKGNNLPVSFFFTQIFNLIYYNIFLNLDCVIAKMNKYELTDQGHTWDQAVKTANRYC